MLNGPQNPSSLEVPATYNSQEFAWDRDREVDDRIIITLANLLEIHPAREDYTQGSIETAFDWQDVLNKVSAFRDIDPADGLFLFVFRSEQRNLSEHETATLEQADIAAFCEAMYDFPDEFLYYCRNKNLSWCLWTGQEFAEDVIHGPAHRRAAQLTRGTYESVNTAGYTVRRAGEGSRVELNKLFEHSLLASDMQ
jgi:hypothetical protein